MKKNKFIVVLSLLAILGAGYLLAFNKSSKEDARRNLINEGSPVAELIDAEGNAAYFDDFKGKILFVNNWASWCPPCIAEMPTIQELKNKMPADEVAFVMISYDRDPQKGIDWMKKNDVSLPVYFPGQNLPGEYITNSIPATFVLDRNGNLLHKQVGMADYSSVKFVNKMKEWIARQ